MSDPSKLDLEGLWNALLSRQPDQVKLTFEQLSIEEQLSVFSHLKRMVEEPGWHPEQQTSAQVAIDAIQNVDRK